MNRLRMRFALLVTAGLSMVACESSRTVAPIDLAPAASSAVGAVKRLEWAFDHREVATVAGILSADAGFLAASTDSAGSFVATDEWTREELLIALRSMFEGVPGISEPAVVVMQLGRDLSALPDPSPGRDPEVHRSVRSRLSLHVDDPTSRSVFQAEGSLLFQVSRGDSVAIPAEEIARGVQPDASRWWIDRLEDESLPSAGARTSPASKASLSSILRFYRDRVKP